MLPITDHLGLLLPLTLKLDLFYLFFTFRYSFRVPNPVVITLSSHGQPRSGTVLPSNVQRFYMTAPKFKPMSPDGHEEDSGSRPFLPSVLRNFSCFDSEELPSQRPSCPVLRRLVGSEHGAMT
ncbi:uncharacterized protein CIMG_11382 [Coccidioides immitis RS]|uniref:Uncharacterized protein n=3 Tax=Coccidioides immitis TaxID=5501 RepID=A0A0D8JXM7_COCIM|nr:uncharacterized protein CIMG_11382 [Coccidioides immitis RS]KJF61028.1 hypothetical protein CIMG_11382 [Coccidioides immitis RS]KMP04894.1 hypothetical protein CIRG_04575 [Coccidioides immitis RMSCC 2394]KMU78089.1 hypothetical protein CISG_06930 [Coccidioides immitis RMSCC 3703]